MIMALLRYPIRSDNLLTWSARLGADAGEPSLATALPPSGPLVRTHPD
jgi:hypothetical protein